MTMALPVIVHHLLLVATVKCFVPMATQEKGVNKKQIFANQTLVFVSMEGHVLTLKLEQYATALPHNLVTIVS